MEKADLEQHIREQVNYWTQDFHDRQIWIPMIEELVNPIILGDHKSFVWEDLDHPQNIQLKDHYNLKEIVKESSNDFDALCRLMHWIYSQWKHSPTKNPSRFDALTILEEAQKGGQFVCAAYACVFIQCCTALGFPARGLGSSGLGFNYIGGHFQTEAWSNKYRKWILFDPTNDIIYFKDEIPQNAAELVHQTELNRMKDVRMQVIDPEFDWIQFNDADPRGYFHSVSLDMHNLFFVEPYEQAFKKHPRWIWLDEGVVRAFPLEATRPANYTSDATKVYFTVNQAFIQPVLEQDWNAVKSTDAPKIKLLISNTMPWFSHYLVEVNGNRIEVKDESCVVEFAENMLRATVFPVNKRGRRGIPAILSITLKRYPFLERTKPAEIIQMLSMLISACEEYGLRDCAAKCQAKKMKYETIIDGS